MNLFKKLILLFAIFPVSMSGMLVYDFFAPSDVTDRVVVNEVSELKDFPGQYDLRASGEYEYGEGISFDVYSNIKEGDVLVFELTPLFYELRKIYLVGEDDELIFLGEGVDVEISLWFSLIFLTPLLAFLPIEKIWITKYRWVTYLMLPLFDLVGMLLWVQVLRMWLGYIDKV